jgi:uncharacterized protein YbaR (Trm112 family)/SAM-dependent methyltransferase
MNPLDLLPFFYRTRTKAARLRNHLRPRRSWRVLDIGSGDGPTPAADVLCDRFVGDDTERNAPILLDRPFVSGDVEHLPFRDQAFDFVYCSHLLEHTRDPARAIAELERVARAGYVEVPSEYLERAAKSTPTHFWFVRREGDALVFSPKPEGVLNERLNRIFDQELMGKDPLYTAFHWARFYSLFNIGISWQGRLPCRVEGPPAAQDSSFTKGAEEADSPGRLIVLGQVIARARAASRGAPGWRGGLKRLIRRWYASGKTFDLFDLLACPQCRGALSPSADRSRLVCASCRLAYPLIDGVPILVPSSARADRGS